MLKKTLVFIGHDATRTGAPTSLLNIVKWIASNTELQCATIFNTGGPLVDEYKKYGSVHLWNKPDQPRRSVASRLIGTIGRRVVSQADRAAHHQASIIELLKSAGVTCIFNNTGVNGRILERLKPQLQVPVVSRIPELEAYMRKNNKDGSAESVLALSDHVIAVSRSVKDNLVNHHRVPPGKITVVYGASSTMPAEKGKSGLRQRLGIPPDAFIVGACGTMDWRKGIDLFIQVAKLTADNPSGARIYFLWIGGCVSRNSCIEYEYELELLRIKDRCFFLGEVANTAPYMADMDLFLLTSREDPFPLVMLEAARQGKPLICFEDSGGASEFVNPGVGIKVPMLDVTRMADAVIKLMHAPTLLKKLGEAAYQESLQYSHTRMGKEVFDVLRNVAHEFQ